MKTQTELAIRSIAGMDEEVTKDLLDKAILVLKNEVEKVVHPIYHVLRFREVEELLHVKPRTINYYVNQGYLDRVYGGGKRAVGITRESFERFCRQRVVSNAS